MIRFLKNPHAILLAVTLLITVFFQYFFLHNVKLYVDSDTAIYAMLADRFANGQWNTAFHIWWQPFYPAVAGLVKHLTENSVTALYLVSFFTNAFLLIPIYTMTNLITHKRYWSIVTAFFVATNYYLVTSIPILLTENFYIFLLISGVALFFIFINKRKIIYLICASVFFAFAYMTRSEGLLFFLFSVAYIALLLIIEKRIKEFFLFTILCFVTFFFAISPYLLFMHNVFHPFNFSAKTNASLTMEHQFYLDNKKTSTFAQDVWSIDTPNYAASYFYKSPDYFTNIGSFVENAKIRTSAYFLDFYRIHGALLIVLFFFVLTGMIFFLKRKDVLYIIYILVTGFPIMMIFIPQAELRYVFWTIPLLFFLASLGIFIIYRTLLKRRYKIFFVSIILLQLLPLLTAYQVGIPDRFVPGGDKYVVVGAYLKKNPKIHRIMNRVEAYSYYSGKVMIYTPNTNATVRDLYYYMKYWKVDRLIADRDTLATDHYLSVLLDLKKKPDWLNVDKVIDVNGEKIIIYKLR